MPDEREELLLSVTLARKVVEEANAEQDVLLPFLLKVLPRNGIEKFYRLNVKAQERIGIRL
jgi:hypothetical protein